MTTEQKPHSLRETKALKERFEKVSSKAVTIGASILIALISVVYSDMRDRVAKVEERVSFLYNDKVSRSEFLDTLKELKSEMVLNRQETDRQIQSVKTEIIDRLDLIIRFNKGSPLAH